MACAVAMPSHVPSMKFKGDSTDLVDRLVEACNTVKVVPAKIVERDLQPFCFDECPPLPKASPSARSPRGSPRCSPPKQQKVARKADATSCSSKSNASASARTPKQAVPSRFVSLDGADELAKVLKGSGSIAPTTPNEAMACQSTRACPGFFSSPRPCEIPMPTSTLLVKATLVKA